AVTSISVTSVSPPSEDYGSTAPVAISATLTWTGSGSVPTASAITIGGSGLSGSFGTTSCGAPSGTTITCTNTYTPSGTDVPGSYTMTAGFAGDTNYSASSSSQSNNFAINPASSTTLVTSGLSPSSYGQQVTFTATITGEFNLSGRRPAKKGARTPDVGGTVTWSANTGCGTTSVTSGNPGVATCTTSRASSLEVGTDVVTATYNGDSNHSGSSGSVNQVVQGGIATSISVTNVSPASETYNQDAQVTITAVLSWTGNGVAPTASNVTISGNGNGTYGTTSCAARVHETITCTNTYTPTSADNVGSYTETAAFTGDSNYSSSSSSQTDNFAITKPTATVTLSNMTQTYTGSPLSPTVTTTPAGLSYSLTGAPDTNAGSYAVTATVTDPNYTGSASGTFVISKAAATVALSNMTQT